MEKGRREPLSLPEERAEWVLYRERERVTRGAGGGKEDAGGEPVTVGVFKDEAGPVDQAGRNDLWWTPIPGRPTIQHTTRIESRMERSLVTARGSEPGPFSTKGVWYVHRGSLRSRDALCPMSLVFLVDGAVDVLFTVPWRHPSGHPTFQLGPLVT